MKIKKWQLILAATMLLLLMVIGPLAVFAETGDGAAGTRPQWEGGLAIVASRSALVGQEMSLGVFLRQNQETVDGVTVWGISKEAAGTLKDEMKALKEKGDSLTESDYDSALGPDAFRMGKTGSDGRLTYTFEKTGNFIILAFRVHYLPDIAGIAVRGGGETCPALDIHAPRKAGVEESVTITVLLKASSEPVKDTAVWALTREQAEALHARIKDAGEANELKSIDWEAEVKALSAVLLGTTNGSGDLKCKFDTEGARLLVALKPDFLPARAGIAIVAARTAGYPGTVSVQ